MDPQFGVQITECIVGSFTEVENNKKKKNSGEKSRWKISIRISLKMWQSL